MPLLNKQKFVRKAIPEDLDPDELVFYSKLTKEIFLDYDEYFERTILCNSLVWTCALTGKSNLTYSEALEHEENARKLLSKFPYTLEKAIVYLISLTKRGNIRDLLDDVFSFVKDRYFIGENVQLIVGQTSNSKSDVLKTCKIIDVLMVGDEESKANNASEDDEDMSKEQMEHDGAQSEALSEQSKPKELVDAANIKYIVETQMNGNAIRQTVRAGQLSRTKNLLTKEKVHILVKLNCEINENQIWTLTDEAMNSYEIKQMRFTDIFKGNAPQFQQTFGRGQFSRKSLNSSTALATSPNKQSNSGKQSNNQTSNGKSPNRKQQLSKNQTKSSSNLNSSTKSKSNKSVSPKQQNGKRKSTTALENGPSKKRTKSLNSPQSTSKSSKTNNHQHTANATHKKDAQHKADKQNESFDDEEAHEFANRIVRILDKKVIEMDDEEYELWRDFLPDEDMKEIAQLESEMDKILKREEKEKEKERIRNEKNKQKELLKELKKPKEDVECENLLELPQAQEICAKIGQNMFSDALMILEFLNNFGDLFELKDDFPNGFNYEMLENALFSKTSDSALCNLLLFYLDTIFKCYDEENFDDSSDLNEDESLDEDTNESDSEEVKIEHLYNEPVQNMADRESIMTNADHFIRLIKSVQGRHLKTIGLDVYTISEMLRLYFITSGCSHQAKIKFWYQQRGGYTSQDETGIDFILNERDIIKKLESTSVFELDAEEKLKILTTLCHQLMSQVRFRDLIEDNWQKLNQLKAQLKDLQTEENRRLKEESSERWKKKLEERAEKKARLEDAKQNPSNGKEAKPSKERSSLSNDATPLTSTSAAALAKEAKEQQEEEARNQKKRDEFLRKERQLLEEIHLNQSKYSMCPLGKDRFYRRYWIFKSLPGVFVEDDQYLPDTTPSLEFNEFIKSNIHSLDQIDSATPSSTTSNKWSFFHTQESIEALINSLNERGIRESELKQGLIELKERIFAQLSKHGSLVKHLTLNKEDVDKMIKTCVNENINYVLLNQQQKQNNFNKRLAAKQPALVTTSALSSDFLEEELRDKLLDIEEQIFAGALGNLKVNDRYAWKEALMTNSYDPQCAQLSWSGGEHTQTAEATANKVNNFAKALLQIEQAVEKRFLRLPLGECQKTPDKRKKKHQPNSSDSATEPEQRNQVLHNWEKSLMACTTYSQVFVHLQSLDESIAWSKSALNARCRLCKRKGDAEKMLLCDKCDRGHHIYCLRPPLKSIPDGEWFCPECKPKDVEKTPRKIRKSTLYDESEDSQDVHNNYKRNDETAEDEDSASDDEEMSDEENEELGEDDEEDEEEVDENEEENESEEEKANNESEDTLHGEDDDKENESGDEKFESKGKKKRAGKPATTTAQNKKNNAKESKKKLNGVLTSDADETMEEDDDNEQDEDYDVKRRSNRKRKLTNSEKVATSTKSANKLANTSKTSNTRTSLRTTKTNNNSKQSYTEISDSLDDEEDDEEDEEEHMDVDLKPAAHKRGKTAAQILNDFQQNNTNSRNTEMVHRIKVIEKLLNDMMKHQDGWPFLKPVSKREAPDYFEVIKRPMDFLTIKNNINNYKYNDYTKIIEDIRLVFENCRTYNEPGSDIYRTGDRLANYFEKHAKQAGLLDTKHLASPTSR